MNYIEVNFRRFLIGITIVAIIVILYFIAFYFDQKKWRKNLKEGDKCDIKYGSERIHDCTVIYDFGDNAIIQDPWNYTRTMKKNDIYKPSQCQHFQK